MTLYSSRFALDIFLSLGCSMYLLLFAYEMFTSIETVLNLETLKPSLMIL